MSTTSTNQTGGSPRLREMKRTVMRCLRRVPDFARSLGEKQYAVILFDNERDPLVQVMMSPNGGDMTAEQFMSMLADTIERGQVTAFRGAVIASRTSLAADWVLTTWEELREITFIDPETLQPKTVPGASR